MATGSSTFACVADFEEYARRVLPRYAFLYFISGAEEEQTKDFTEPLEDNKNAFARFVISMYFLVYIEAKLSLKFREDGHGSTMYLVYMVK